VDANVRGDQVVPPPPSIDHLLFLLFCHNYGRKKKKKKKIRSKFPPTLSLNCKRAIEMVKRQKDPEKQQRTFWLRTFVVGNLKTKQN
jgi:hypothetical protein